MRNKEVFKKTQHMMIDDVNTKYDQKEPKKEKVDESRFGWWWCAPRRGKTLPACLPGRVSCTIKCCYTREIVLMAFYTCVFCFALYVDAFDNEVLLSYWLAEVCFFPFVFFCSFDYFRSIVVVNCVVVFTFSQTAHNNQRILFYMFA